jgi:hypothetical protein
MRKVYKFKIDLDDCTLDMPQGAAILDLQSQYGVHYLWALVDVTAPKQTRRFITVDTGQPLPDGECQHIASVQTHGGRLLHHVFEVFA